MIADPRSCDLPCHLRAFALLAGGAPSRYSRSSGAVVPVSAFQCRQCDPLPTRRTSMSAPMSADLAQIGKSVVIKGELSGSEDLYVDGQVDRKSTRLNSSHPSISYAVFCLKKKK